MAPPRIVVVGSSNADMTITLERLPRPGETMLGGDFLMTAGGKGANQAVAAARAGGDVTFIARVGRDVFGDQAIAGLVADRINVQHVVRDEHVASGVALIFVGADGENSIAVAGGANSRLSPDDVDAARDAIAQASAVLMQLETPLATVMHAAHMAAEFNVLVILNPAPAQELPGELLKLVTILTPNEHEAKLLTGIEFTGADSARAAAHKLLDQGVKTVVVTLGARGALVASREQAELAPGFVVTPVDTVAAGDVFNGALAVALGEGAPLVDAVRFANAAAALSVTRRGAQASAPLRVEIDGMLRGPADPSLRG
jgi:ribokinase